MWWGIPPLSVSMPINVQYIPRNMHTVFALLCFVVVIHWLIFPYPSGLLHWHCGNLTIAPVPAKQPWWIWINTSCEFIMNDCITTTKQSTTKPCAYFLGYTVCLSTICRTCEIYGSLLFTWLFHLTYEYTIKKHFVFSNFTFTRVAVVWISRIWCETLAITDVVSSCWNFWWTKLG